MSVRAPAWSGRELDVMRIGLGFAVIFTIGKIQFFRPQGDPLYRSGSLGSSTCVGQARAAPRGGSRSARLALHRANGRLLGLPFPQYQLLVLVYPVNVPRLFR